MIAVIGENNTVTHKKASDIKIGDNVWGVTWDGLDSEFSVDPYTWSSPEVNNLDIVPTVITNIIPSVKEVTLCINNDSAHRFSLEQTILVKRSGMYFFGVTGILEPGDEVIIRNEDGSFSPLPVNEIQIIDESRNVYEFDAAPNDTLIAGGLVVHNRKAFA